MILLKKPPKEKDNEEQDTVTDIIEKSQELSGDWLTKDIEQQFPKEQKERGEKKKRQEK